MVPTADEIRAEAKRLHDTECDENCQRSPYDESWLDWAKRRLVEASVQARELEESDHRETLIGNLAEHEWQVFDGLDFPAREEWVREGIRNDLARFTTQELREWWQNIESDNPTPDENGAV